jgi:hypothetical protein
MMKSAALVALLVAGVVGEATSGSTLNATNMATTIASGGEGGGLIVSRGTDPRYGGKCLTRFGALGDPYNAVGFADCKKTSTQQLWEYDNTTGNICIANMGDPHNPMCLSIACAGGGSCWSGALSSSFFGGFIIAAPPSMGSNMAIPFAVNDTTGSFYFRGACSVQLNIQYGVSATLYNDKYDGDPYDCTDPSDNEVFAFQSP